MIVEVAKREVVVRARTKSFRIITALLLLVAVAAPVAVRLWPSNDGIDEVSIGLGSGMTTDDGADLPAMLVSMGQQRYDFTFVDLSDASPAEVDAAIIGESAEGLNVDVVVEPGPTLAWKDRVDDELGFLIASALRQQGVLDRGAELGLTDEQIGAIVTPTTVTDRFVEEPDEFDETASLLAMLGLMTAFIIPQVFGQLALQSVVEEKSSGVVEVLLGQIRPRTLLAGKILGIGVLAVCQIAIVVGGMVGALLLLSDLELPGSPWMFVAVLSISLLGGMASYITLYALLGSLISRQEDAAQVMVPVFLPLMAGYIVGQTAAFGAADSLAAKVLTFIPLTTPMLLPVRVARNAISGVEIAVALGLLVLSVAVLVRLAERLYEFTLLRKGTRIGWVEAFRGLRAPSGS